jgi:hypothetical protein
VRLVPFRKEIASFEFNRADLVPRYARYGERIKRKREIIEKNRSARDVEREGGSNGADASKKIGTAARRK